MLTSIDTLLKYHEEFDAPALSVVSNNDLLITFNCHQGTTLELLCD